MAEGRGSEILKALVNLQEIRLTAPLFLSRTKDPSGNVIHFYFPSGRKI